MARLPQPADLQRLPKPAATPGIRVGAIDYGPELQGEQQIARGVQGLADAGGKLIDLTAKTNNEIDDYETRKRLLDFKLQTEMELEQHKRAMPQGGVGYAESWAEKYQQRAREFVGEGDANIPARLRNQVGLLLKHHETVLGERAQRDAWAERDRTEIEGLEQTLGRTRSFVEADPTRRDEMLMEGRRLIDASRIAPAAKDRLAKHYAKELDKSAVIARLMSAQTADDFKALEKDLAPNAPDKRVPLSLAADGAMTVVTAGSGAKFRVAGSHADRFAGLISDLEAAGVTLKPEASGGYANRNIAGTNIRSKHADGLAIDLNWDENARGAPGKLRDQIGVDQLRALAAKHGLKWGGDFKNPDDMHFEVDPAGQPPRPVAQRGITSFAGATREPESYAGPYGTLSISERKAFHGQIETQRRKMVGEVEKAIRDQMAVAADGYAPPAPIQAEIEKRVQALGDPMLAAQYQAMMRKAEITQALRRAPPGAIEDLARRERAALDAGGATKEQDEAVKHVEALGAAVRKNVNDNPMGWAAKAGITVPLADGPPDNLDPGQRARWQMPMRQVQLEQINFGAADIDRVLADRVETAKGVARYYGQPVQMFTTAERDALKDSLKLGGPVMLYTMGHIASAAGKAGVDPALVMKEITKDAPEVAHIGTLVAEGGDPRVLETAAKALAWKHQMGEKFESTIDKVQAKPDLAEFADVLKSTPTKVDHVKALANTVYEYEARAKGLKQFDPETYRGVVRKIMGETVAPDGTAYGGVGQQGRGWFDFRRATPVLVPAGVRQDRFDEMVEAVRANDLIEAGGVPMTGNGEPLTMQEIRRATWVSVGPGRYALKLKDDHDGTGVYAKADGDKPYVIDVRSILPRIRQRRPDIFAGYNPMTDAVPKSTPDPALPSWLSLP